MAVLNHCGHTIDRARRAGFLLIPLWIFDDQAFAFLGQVAVTVAIHVQDIDIEDNPGAALRFRTEDQQAVAWRLALIGRFNAIVRSILVRSTPWAGRAAKSSRRNVADLQGSFIPTILDGLRRAAGGP